MHGCVLRYDFCRLISVLQGKSDSNAIVKLQITEKKSYHKAPNVFSQPNYGRPQPVSAGTRPWRLTSPRNIKSAVETVVCYVR